MTAPAAKRKRETKADRAAKEIARLLDVIEGAACSCHYRRGDLLTRRCERCRTLRAYGRLF